MTKAISLRRERQISYLLEVLATNRYQGQHILLSTYKDAEPMGIIGSSVRTVRCGPNPVLKGLHITAVPRTNGTIPGQQDIIDHFVRYPALYNMRHRPVIGEVITGPFKGKRIGLMSSSEIRQYFSIDAVRTASPLQWDYAGLRWFVAETFKEAERYYCQSDQGWLKSVMRRHYRYNNSPATEEQHVSFQQQLKQVAIGMQQWYRRNEHQKNIAIEQYVVLAHWCHMLDQAITCHEQYLRVRDTLLLLQDILVKHHQIKPNLFMGHCKILERLACEPYAFYRR